MDATAVLSGASWVLAELVRVFHGVTPVEAQSAVDALVAKRHPLVWSEGDVRRVLDADMGKADQTLVLLYSANDWVDVAELIRWVEYSNPTVFRKSILVPAHRNRVLEYDRREEKAKLTPRGIAEVENRLFQVAV